MFFLSWLGLSFVFYKRVFFVCSSVSATKIDATIKSCWFFSLFLKFYHCSFVLGGLKPFLVQSKMKGFRLFYSIHKQIIKIITIHIELLKSLIGKIERVDNWFFEDISFALTFTSYTHKIEGKLWHGSLNDVFFFFLKIDAIVFYLL